MLRTLLTLIFIFLPITVYSSSTIEIFEKTITDSNIKNAFIDYYKARSEFLKTNSENKTDAFKKLSDSTKCLYSFLSIIEEVNYVPYLEKINEELNRNQNSTKLNFVNSNLEEVKKSRSGEDTKLCAFKLDNEALNDLRTKENEQIKQIEDNYNALIQYKAHAHPLVSKIITTCEGSPLDANLPLEMKRDVFLFFTDLMTFNDSSVASTIKNTFSKECLEQTKAVFKNKCEKKRIYTEIPGPYNRIFFCITDHKTEINPECIDSLKIKETIPEQI